MLLCLVTPTVAYISIRIFTIAVRLLVENNKSYFYYNILFAKIDKFCLKLTLALMNDSLNCSVILLQIYFCFYFKLFSLILIV